MTGTRADGGPPHVHGTGRAAQTGAAPERAAAAMILVHGRGGTAAGILTLAGEMGRDDVAYLAPQAAGGVWYPQRFLAPLAANEPGLSSALRVLAEILAELSAAGIPPERTVLAGFSQGACLALEFAARHARRYGAVIAFTGALLGPAGSERTFPGGFEGTPALLGSSVPDAHVPWERVRESAALLERMGAEVDLRGYPGMPHTINDEEIAAARRLLDRVASAPVAAGTREGR